MVNYSKIVITNNGQALITKMMSGTTGVKFTKVCSSSAVYSEQQIVNLVALADIKQTSLISKIDKTNNTALALETAFTNTDLKTGYYMRTLGLYAVDPDKGEILYGVCVAADDNCYMPPYNGVTSTGAFIKLYQTVGNASSVNLNVDPGAVATIGNIQALEKEISDLQAFVGYTTDDVYGVEVDFKNRRFTRLAGAKDRIAGSGFDDIECFGGRKRVNLTDNGVELSAYGEAGYTETGALTQAVSKNGVTYPVGTAVQVMVKNPQFYYKVVPLELERAKYPQMEEVIVTGAATTGGTITVTIGGEKRTINIDKNASTGTVAGQFANLAFSNFQTRNSGTTVRYVSRISGKRDKLSIDCGTTGVTVKVTSYAETPSGGFHMRKARYYVSPVKKVGFKLHPKFIQNGLEKKVVYTAAYESSIYDTSAGKYLHADEQIADFTASTGDKLASIAGSKPCSGNTQDLTRAHARTLASNRGAGWSQNYTIAASGTEMLMLIEYASFDMQKNIGAGNVNRSWIEDGVNWSESTGATSTLGNKSGAVTIEVVGQKGGTDKIVMVSYRGEENPWGGIWKFEDGTNVYANWKHDIYIADHDFADSKSDGSYSHVAFPWPFVEGFISAMGYDEKFDFLFIGSETNGDSSLPVGDYDYSNVADNGWHIVRSGASWGSGLRAGAFCRRSDDWVGSRSRDVSAGRLVYVPKETA